MSQSNEIVFDKSALSKASDAYEIAIDKKRHETEMVKESECNKIKSLLNKMINKELPEQMDKKSKRKILFNESDGIVIKNHILLKYVRDFRNCGIDKHKIEKEVRKTSGIPVVLQMWPYGRGIIETDHHYIRLEVGTPAAVAFDFPPLRSQE